MHCKIVRPKGSIVLKYVSSTKHPFDEQVDRVLQQGFPPVFLEYTALASSPTAYEVCFDVTRMAVLSDHVRKPMAADELRMLFEQTKQMLDTCVARGLPLRNVVLDVNQVYYDSWKRSLRFVYLPFGGIPVDQRKTQAFFVNLADKIRPADAVAAQMADAYRDYARAASVFDPTGISACLGDLCSPRQGPSAEPRVARTDDDPNASGETVPPNSSRAEGTTVLSDLASPSEEHPTLDGRPISARPASSARVRGRHAHVDPGTAVLDAVKWNDITNGAFEDDRLDISMGLEYDLRPAPVSDVSSVSDVSDSPRATSKPAADGERSESGTTVLSDPAAPQTPRFWLTRASTAQRFEVKGEGFIVGKSKYCSYQVTGTNTVSRKHALFYCEQDACWVEDNGSTNGTFVNGDRMAPHTRHRLRNGDQLRMSDEDFLFEVQQPSV